MKNKIMVLLLSGAMVLAAFGCEKYADTAPGLAVYKTKGDYFYNVSVGIKKNGDIIGRPNYYNSRNNSIGPRIKIIDGDTVYARRAKLINGYIVSHEIGDNSIFVDFTHKEYLQYEINNPGSTVPSSILSENILDNDPFLELYIDKSRPRNYSLVQSLSDTMLINEMIRDGELEKYFERVK